MKKILVLLVIAVMVFVGAAVFGFSNIRVVSTNLPVSVATHSGSIPLPAKPTNSSNPFGLRAAYSTVDIMDGKAADYDRSIKSKDAVGDRVRMLARLENQFIPIAGTDEYYLEILLNADNTPVHSERSPMNVALVIDISGSMASERKLEHVKQAAVQFVQGLSKQDTLSLVTFESRAEVLFPACKATEANKANMKRIIRALHTKGGTDLGSGFKLGFEQAVGYVDQERVSRIILLSDGLANEGITSQDTLVRMASDYMEKGVTLSTLGVGRGYNEYLMTALSKAGSGNYYFVDTPAEIELVYAKEFSALSTAVAKNINLKIDLPDGVSLVQVFGYDHKASKNRIEIPIASLASGEKRSVTLQLKVPGGKAQKLGDLSVTMNYADQRQDGKSLQFAQFLPIERIKSQKKIEKNWNREVAKRIFMIKGATALNESAEMIQSGKHAQANKYLKSKRAELSTYNDAKLKDYGQALDQLLMVDKNLTDDASVTYMFSQDPEQGKQALRNQKLSRQSYYNEIVK